MVIYSNVTMQTHAQSMLNDKKWINRVGNWLSLESKQFRSSENSRNVKENAFSPRNHLFPRNLERSINWSFWSLSIKWSPVYNFWHIFIYDTILETSDSNWQHTGTRIWISIVKLYVYCFEFGVQKYPTSTFTGLFFCLLNRVKLHNMK